LAAHRAGFPARLCTPPHSTSRPVISFSKCVPELPTPGAASAATDEAIWFVEIGATRCESRRPAGSTKM